MIFVNRRENIPIERFKSIFDELPIPIHIWQKVGDEFIFSYYNKVNDKLANENLKNYLGISASKLHKDNPELIKNLKKCVRENKSFSRDVICRLKKTGKKNHFTILYSFISPDLIFAVTHDKSKIYDKEKRIKHKSDLQHLICKISSQFVKIDEFNKSLHETLEDIGKFCGASRSYMFLINNEERIISNTHEWTKEEVEPQIKNLQNIRFEDIRWFLKELDREKRVNIQNISKLPSEAKKLKKMLQKQDIKSMLNYPLYNNDTLVGFIGLDNTEKISEWDQVDFDTLKITSEIIGNALERKKNEKNLEELTIELEMKVRKRTKELKESEEMYREAYEMANFYKNLIAHDMNNILQNIRSSMQLGLINIEKDKDLSELKELFEIINEQTVRGAKLVDNIRKISNLERGDKELYKLDVCEYLSKAIKTIKDSNKSRNIEIKVESELKETPVKANKFIEDLFENILINSIKYNDSPMVKIDISIQNETKAKKDFIKLEFEDNGIGIEDSRKTTIFEPGNKQKKRRNGLGVGLSLVKKIIDNYNGEIWVEDKVKGNYNEGSKFIILLPALN